jgi:hypothetical protein
VIGSELKIFAPANCKVPPVKIGPDEPVQPNAPDVFALKVSPLASSALPLEHMAGNRGSDPDGTLMVAVTVLVAVLMTTI